MPLNPSFAVGIDISQHNGAYDPTVKPVDFVIARATIGLLDDERFREYHEALAGSNTIIMAYHYYKTNLPWRLQADNLIERTKVLPVSMLFWDYEAGGNYLTKQTALDSVTAMSYIRQQSGKPVGLYADRQRTFNIYRDASASMNFPLWVAQYYTEKPYWDSIPNIEPKYKPQFSQQMPWLFWQYASELNWLGHDAGHEYGLESHSVDLDVCKKTPAELRAYLGLWQPSPVEPTDAEKLATLWKWYKDTHL